MRSNNNLRLALLLAVGAGSGRGHASYSPTPSTFRSRHSGLPLSRKTSWRTIPVARGDVPQAPWIVRVGADGGLVLEGGGNRISVLGPALFSVERTPQGGFEFRPVFGDFTFRLRNDSGWSVEAVETGGSVDFYLELSASTRLARLRNAGPGLSYQGRAIARGQSLDRQHDSVNLNLPSASELAALGGRHDDNERARPPQTNLDLEPEKPADPRLTGWATFDPAHRPLPGLIPYLGLSWVGLGLGATIGYERVAPTGSFEGA